MAKIIDITDKLSFDGNPKLKIKGKEVEVNSDAPTVLKIMGLTTKEGNHAENMAEACDILFPAESREILDDLKLSFNDFITVIQCAIETITGEAPQGE